MATFLRSFLAVVLGLVIGSVVNMGLIMAGGKVVPPPAGADVTTIEGLKASIHLFETKHFLFPFLAHALGTLAGALTATLVVLGRTAVPAYFVGAFFLCGGIAGVVMIPGPVWFAAVDLLLAYVPTTLLGIVSARRMLGARGAGA